MRKPCEDKTMCNCETSGYSTNTILMNTMAKEKKQDVNLSESGLCKDMYIHT
jgi:hypothetical protein